MGATAPDHVPRVRIAPIVAEAEAIGARVRRDLPDHPGLASLCDSVAVAAREAQAVAMRLRRPIGLHRLPVVFLVIVVVALVVFGYQHLFAVSQVAIGLPDRDSVHLRAQLAPGVHFRVLRTAGSADGLSFLKSGRVDVAVVQGGLDLWDDETHAGWLVRQMPFDELVLLFVRGERAPRDLKYVLTSTEGQGSHKLALALLNALGATQVHFAHTWQRLVYEQNYTVPAEIDGVLVVKDMASDKVERAARTLAAQGFRLVSPYIGGAASRMRYLKETTIRPGYVSVPANIPAAPLESYNVASCLVMRPDLTPRQLAAIESLVRDPTAPLATGFELTLNNTSELLQGVESGMGILVYMGVAFLALLGIDIYTYRNRFNDLNSLVSLISMHQSTHGAIQSSPEERSKEVGYLRVCSDLLGLVGVITGYYAQENPSLMYNGLLEVIHSRASSMKLNIQLKILHALIDLPVPPEK